MTKKFEYTLNKQHFFSKKIVLLESMVHGYGRFLVENAFDGELLIEAGGVLVERENFILNPSLTFIPFSNELILVTESCTIMNATSLNHSCSPNLLFNFPYWIAKRKILAGEELTIDYSQLGYENFGFDILINKCNCKSVQCRNIIYASV